MNPDSSYRDRLFLRGHHYIGEAREPDGSWRRVTSGDDFRTVARTMRRWRQDRGHLMPETRVRIAREGDR